MPLLVEGCLEEEQQSDAAAEEGPREDVCRVVRVCAARAP
jgi:hypothetical protein